MDADLIQEVIAKRNVRRAVTRDSHRWFFHVFLGHYIEYPMALFHEEMFALTESEAKLVAVMAFRGSGKSTVMNTSCALWSVLGKPQKKFVLILSKTQNQAKAHFMNIRRELEMNRLLAADLGPFEADETAFGMHSLTLKRMGAKITIVSRDQSIRGLRYGIHRPDLIILDDVEDSALADKDRESAQTYRWFQSEVLTAGGKDTKIIVLGNLIHENSFLMRLRNGIKERRLPGEFRAYPIVDDNEKILWPGKFPDASSIAALKASVPDEEVWMEEYLLQVYVDGEIRRYDLRDEKKIDDDPQWDKEKFPARRFGPYVISVPILIPKHVVYAPKVLSKAEWHKATGKTPEQIKEMIGD